jgi:hypothetical protein
LPAGTPPRFRLRWAQPRSGGVEAPALEGERMKCFRGAAAAGCASALALKISVQGAALVNLCPPPLDIRASASFPYFDPELVHRAIHASCGKRAAPRPCASPSRARRRHRIATSSTGRFLRNPLDSRMARACPYPHPRVVHRPVHAACGKRRSRTAARRRSPRRPAFPLKSRFFAPAPRRAASPARFDTR